MAHNTTVFRQLLDLLPRHEFDAEARQHQEGQRLRVMSRWAQFVALGLGQLGGLQSLRDIVGNLRAQPHKLYHLGVRAFVSRSSLARVNAQQPYTLYEALFGRLLMSSPFAYQPQTTKGRNGNDKQERTKEGTREEGRKEEGRRTEDGTNNHEPNKGFQPAGRRCRQQIEDDAD